MLDGKGWPVYQVRCGVPKLADKNTSAEAKGNLICCKGFHEDAI